MDRGGSTAQFKWQDYCVFALSISVSCGVGVYYSIVGRRKPTAEEYLMAGRSMSIFPVALSMFVSFFSAISFLGDPFEAYTHGTQYWAYVAGYCVAAIFVGLVYAPRYHRMGLTSLYEILELKLGRPIRILGSTVHLIYLLMYLSLAMYAPSLAISQATGLPIIWTIALVSAISTFYTTLGGLKAVLWVDTFQTSVMLAGIIAVVVKGSMILGGFSPILDTAREAGRLQPWGWSPNPTEHRTVWSYAIGGFFRVFTTHLALQFIGQRMCVVRSPKHATWMVLSVAPLYAIAPGLLGFVGILMSAYYYGCDPLKAGVIHRGDQMIVLLTLQLFRNTPGIPGLFVATVCTAALSTLSSGQNAVALNILKDFMDPIYKRVKKRPISEKWSLYIAKILSGLSGAVLVGTATLVMKSGRSVFQFNSSVNGCLVGPVAALINIALFAPFVGAKACFIGFFVGFGIPAWMVIGSLLYSYSPSGIPVSTELCGLYHNSTDYLYSSTNPATTSSNLYTTSVGMDTVIETIPWMYRLSPLWYPPLGFGLTLFTAFLICAITVLYKKNRPSDQKQNEELYITKKDEKQPEIYPLNGADIISEKEILKMKFNPAEC